MAEARIYLERKKDESKKERKKKKKKKKKKEKRRKRRRKKNSGGPGSSRAVYKSSGTGYGCPLICQTDNFTWLGGEQN